MSASEKLKMLKPDAGDLDWERGTIALWEALPQIVTVVDQAEALVEIYKRSRRAHEESQERIQNVLAPALADLEKALSE